MPPLVDLTGSRFGLLTVISRASNGRCGHVRWICLCDCGNYKIIHGNNLKTGDTNSCGCLHRKIVMRHGKSNRPIYMIWDAMVQRCNNPNNVNYKNYGGRGIIICNRWLKFENFLADMGEPPTNKHSIDRIDNNGHYCSKNCRWVTKKQQMRNTRRNSLITYNNKTQCLAAWAEEMGINQNTIFMRLNRGWSIKKALTTIVT